MCSLQTSAPVLALIAVAMAFVPKAVARILAHVYLGTSVRIAMGSVNVMMPTLCNVPIDQVVMDPVCARAGLLDRHVTFLATAEQHPQHPVIRMMVHVIACLDGRALHVLTAL
jgi:hypothetical protein